MKPAADRRMDGSGVADAPGSPKRLAAAPAASRLRAGLLLAGVAVVTLVFLALGTWQVERLQWKRDLIRRVDQRIHAAPVAPPGRGRWPAINAADDEYRHVQVQGRFLLDRTVPVQAVTVLGGGFWLLTPLQQPDGDLVLINRGFVPTYTGASRPVHNATPAQPADVPLATVSGLLRISEPGGAFLRRNDPSAGRWYSRDVAAIAKAVGLPVVAPYFIDADAAPRGGGGPDRFGAQQPVGGLTVVAFPNSHLVYAVTWYSLALMTAGACLWNTPWGHRIMGDRRRQATGTDDNGDSIQH